MYLPINEKELNFIMKSIKYLDKNLYAKLWSYKMNKLNGEK